MASKYDEDVYENPFFTKITVDFPGYLEEAVKSKGILCVPKYSIASNWTPTQSDVEDHILLPTREIVDDDDDFITVSKKTVHISDNKIVTKNGFDTSRQVPVLFTETFHTDDGDSYRVFCIGGLLNKSVSTSAAGTSPVKSISLQNYRQWLEKLWSNSGGQKMRESMDKILCQYMMIYDRLEGETLRSIVDAANTHFTKAMQLLLKDSGVRRSAQLNPQYMENLKIAVETYVMNAIHKSLFRVITATMASEDAEINKINRNLVDLQLSDLGIRKIFSQNILPAKKELSLLNRYSTPLGRLFCIKRVVSALTKPPKDMSKDGHSKDTVAMMTTDDLLPILIFLIIKSDIPNWMANLTYMRHFHFAKSSDDDEYGFYLASIEAALEHIKSGNIKDEIKPLKRERWNSLLITDNVDGSSSSSPPSSPSSSSSPSPHRQTSHHSTTIDEFFRSVQEGDERRVQQMLEQPHKTSEEIHLKLCHPLCSCDRCDRLMSNLRNNSNLVTAYTRDNRGYTALHIAAYYGQGLLIDLLVKNNAVVDATDYLGLTPLHLACQRGYQNVMLLLLHFGADITATDNEGNTPLHLCCTNGHDDCVKALVFYDASMRKLQINAASEIGDTPLHLAAKWGYESIVRTLLENGADPTLRNRKRQTAVSLAQNVKVQRWLQLSAEGLDFQPVRPQFVNPNANSRSRSSSSSSGSNLNTSFSTHRTGGIDMYEPESSSFRVETASLEAATETERRRKKEKLFKAIIGGDIQLVKFYLGIQSALDDGDDDDDDVVTPLNSVSLRDMCHPLCQCDKCLGIQKATRKTGGDINVDVKTSTGYCPIHMAVLHSHSDIVALLISLKAEISAQNHKGLTPLHLACCVRNSLITDMLVKAEARLDAQDMNGDTPLLIAASNGFVNGVHILIKAGAKINATNGKGNTALVEAVKRDHAEIADVLLNAGADPRIKNKHGKLALDEADDPALQAVILAATYRMDDAEIKRQNHNAVTHNREDRKAASGQISIKDLFAAFEEKDLQALQSLTAAIRSFDRKGTLKKTKTKDRSAPNLRALKTRHSIHNFDQNTLRKIKPVDKNDPRHLYALYQSQSYDAATIRTSSFHSNNDSFDEQLMPAGDGAFFSNFDDPALIPFPEPESFDSDEFSSARASPMSEISKNSDKVAFNMGGSSSETESMVSRGFLQSSSEGSNADAMCGLHGHQSYTEEAPTSVKVPDQVVVSKDPQKSGSDEERELITPTPGPSFDPVINESIIEKETASLDPSEQMVSEDADTQITSVEAPDQVKENEDTQRLNNDAVEELLTPTAERSSFPGIAKSNNKENTASLDSPEQAVGENAETDILNNESEKESVTKVAEQSFFPVVGESTELSSFADVATSLETLPNATEPLDENKLTLQLSVSVSAQGEPPAPPTKPSLSDHEDLHDLPCDSGSSS